MMEMALWILSWTGKGILFGVVVTYGLGIAEGLFGPKGPFAIAMAGVGIVFYAWATQGSSEVFAALYPAPYWIGLVIGSLVAHEPARRLQRKIEIDGESRYRKLA